MEPRGRCPRCNKWGSDRLGGYCKLCFPNNRSEKHVLDDFYVKAEITGEFFSSGDYGAMSDKFGYER